MARFVIICEARPDTKCWSIIGWARYGPVCCESTCLFRLTLVVHFKLSASKLLKIIQKIIFLRKDDVNSSRKRWLRPMANWNQKFLRQRKHYQYEISIEQNDFIKRWSFRSKTLKREFDGWARCSFHTLLAKLAYHAEIVFFQGFSYSILPRYLFLAKPTCQEHFHKHHALSLIHIWRCRRIERCRSRWSPYH